MSSRSSTTTKKTAARKSATSASRERPAPRLAFVVGEFNSLLTEEMSRRAAERAEDLGYEVGPVLRVAGTWDTPLPADLLLAQKDVVGCIVIAVIITGETKHDEIIAHSTAKTLQEIALKHGKPVGLAITGPGQTYAMAEARVDRADHAVDAVHLLLEQLGRAPTPPGKPPVKPTIIVE